MNPQTLDKLIWLFLYAGLLIVGLGLSVRHTDSGLGWGMVAAGVVAIAAGVVLVYLRSRTKD